MLRNGCKQHAHHHGTPSQQTDIKHAPQQSPIEIERCRTASHPAVVSSWVVATSVAYIAERPTWQFGVHKRILSLMKNDSCTVCTK